MSYTIFFRQAITPSELQQAFAVRREVFIKEQKIDAHEEWDGLDDTALHFIALDGESIIGTARVRFLSSVCAKIERMAVLEPARRQGIGRGILDSILTEMRERRIPLVVLHAQVSAAPFYRACGFVDVGSTFLEASIEHIKMQKRVGAI